MRKRAQFWWEDYERDGNGAYKYGIVYQTEHKGRELPNQLSLSAYEGKLCSVMQVC
jgi:hypothetical protein